jgi:hypothetical protein
VLEPLLSCYENFDCVFSLMLKISALMHCILTTITSALIIEFRHMSNGWKAEEVIYDVDIESLLRLHSIWGQKSKFLRLFKSA